MAYAVIIATIKLLAADITQYTRIYIYSGKYLYTHLKFYHRRPLQQLGLKRQIAHAYLFSSDFNLLNANVHEHYIPPHML